MKKRVVIVCMLLAAGVIAWFLIPVHGFLGSAEVIDAVGGLIDPPMPPLPPVTEMRALYITFGTAASAGMDDIIQLIKKTEGERSVNAVVIDIQDSEGKVMFNERMRALVRRLRFLNIFPIARIVAFQNNMVAEQHPEWAIRRANADSGVGVHGPWRDKGGRRWLDPSHRAVWEYIANIGNTAVDYGFGEINLDYFRFPSEGVTTAVYPFWKAPLAGVGQEKTDVIIDAATFLRDSFKKNHPEIAVTADIFGYTFMRRYDVGIGQSAPGMAAVLDAVYPMIYPSHYDSGNFNFENPAAHPYEVMFQTLEKGKEIFKEAQQPFTNIRPWIQDFDLGAVYTVDMVQAQMQAITDAGLSEGWLIWNPRNKYREALFKP